jgi:hypothetical protein
MSVANFSSAKNCGADRFFAEKEKTHRSVSFLAVLALPVGLADLCSERYVRTPIGSTVFSHAF